MFDKLHNYMAKVERIVDGDTIYVTADLGFGISTFLKLRIDGIDAPEIRGEERPDGLVSKAYVESVISVGDEVFIKSYKDGAFGRWSADVSYLDSSKEVWVDLATDMIQKKYAEPSEWSATGKWRSPGE